MGQEHLQSDKQFLDFAAQVNQSEIQGGLAAEKKADAAAVRAYARLMVLDHMALESQLAAIATLGIAIAIAIVESVIWFTR